MECFHKNYGKYANRVHTVILICCCELICTYTCLCVSREINNLLQKSWKNSKQKTPLKYIFVASFKFCYKTVKPIKEQFRIRFES